MTLSEKSAYLKGLMAGLKIDTDKGEGKMIESMVDMLEDIAYAVSDLEDNALAVSDELDEIEEAIDSIEEFLDEEDEEDDDFDYGDEALYEVKCPTCGEVLTLDEATIEEGSTVCPQCGEDLEFDMDDIEAGDSEF